MAHTEGLGTTQAVDSSDDLERSVLESETIGAGDAESDVIGVMTRTLVTATVALEPEDAHGTPHMRRVDPDDRSGDVLVGRYRLVEQLGRGGMGTVYIAQHTTLPKTFAVKLLNARYAKRLDVAERFLQEARAVSLIEHENVVGVIDHGRDEDGSAFLVMEHLRGESLAAMCKREAPLAWPRVRHIMLQLCRALAAAHAVGVVHRDIKPDNVLRTERHGDPDFIKVLDFGLAKLQVGTGLRLTATGMVLGTPDYMSPEQARGLASDQRTDIYGAGVMMYELLCGRVPFQASSFAELRQKHLFELPQPPSTWVPELGEEVDAIVLRALAKQPEQRFASMTEMGEAIAAVGTGTPVSVPEHAGAAMLAERSLIPPSRTSTRQAEPASVASPRRRGVVVAVIVLALLGVGALLLSKLGDTPDVAQREVAPEVSTAVAAPPQSVTLRFETNVPVVLRDLEGGAPFGEQPTHELRIPSSSDAMRLVLTAEGYRELHVVITPDRDQILEATLEPAPAPVPEPESLEATPASEVEPARKPSRVKSSKPAPEQPKAAGPTEASHSFAPEIRDPFGGG